MSGIYPFLAKCVQNRASHIDFNSFGGAAVGGSWCFPQEYAPSAAPALGPRSLLVSRIVPFLAKCLQNHFCYIDFNILLARGVLVSLGIIHHPPGQRSNLDGFSCPESLLFWPNVCKITLVISISTFLLARGVLGSSGIIHLPPGQRSVLDCSRVQNRPFSGQVPWPPPLPPPRTQGNKSRRDAVCAEGSADSPKKVTTKKVKQLNRN